ncbi:hypothetical protein [Niallia sp. Marseille-Q9988]
MSNKKDILLDSFNVLVQNLEKNYDRLENLLIKVLELDQEMAIDMWVHLLDNPQYEKLDEWGKKWLSGYVLGDLADKKGGEYVIDFLRTYGELAEKLFTEGQFEFSTAMSENFTNAYIVPCIYKNNIDDLEKMYEGFLNNKKVSLTKAIEEPLEYYFRYDNQLTIDMANLFLNYLPHIHDKEGKARISVFLIDYL